MTSKNSRRTALLLYLGSFLVILTAGLVSSSDIAWQGVITWGLWILALLLIGTGSLVWRRDQ